MFMSFGLPQMPKMVAVTIGNINLCCLFQWMLFVLQRENRLPRAATTLQPSQADSHSFRHLVLYPSLGYTGPWNLRHICLGSLEVFPGNPSGKWFWRCKYHDAQSDSGYASANWESCLRSPNREFPRHTYCTADRLLLQAGNPGATPSYRDATWV